MTIQFRVPKWCSMFGPLILAMAASAQTTVPNEEVTLPEQQNITLQTRDGVQLRATLYPGGVVRQEDGKFERKPGEEVVPIIMLHGGGGKRGDYSALAFYFQNLGHAVLVPDLRGHGESTKRIALGREMDIDPERLRRDDYNAMVLDVEAAKKLFLDMNNAGEVNIEMLTVIGAELGAIVAVNWSALDWRRPQLPFQKQGRDVKALVLLSPSQSYKGATLSQALNTPAVAQSLSIMIVAGQEDSSDLREAKSIHKRLERFHPEPAPAEVAEKKDLFLVLKPTNLSGVELLDPRVRLGVHIDIQKFIELRLVNRLDSFEWGERKNPLETNSD